jgi:hypothetical protein
LVLTPSIAGRALPAQIVNIYFPPTIAIPNHANDLNQSTTSAARKQS